MCILNDGQIRWTYTRVVVRPLALERRVENTHMRCLALGPPPRRHLELPSSCFGEGAKKSKLVAGVAVEKP
jgi:hypothetical protein